MRYRFIALFLSVFSTWGLFVISAQDNKKQQPVLTDSVSIVDSINNDTTSTIEFIQPAELNDRLLDLDNADDSQTEGEAKKSKKVVKTGKNVSYTIVAFNKANQRDKAMEIARTINSKFPQYRAKVTSNLPYWQVSVGPFFDEDDARKAMSSIRSSVPGTSPTLRKKNIVVTK